MEALVAHKRHIGQYPLSVGLQEIRLEQELRASDDIVDASLY
jgi:hypothetical protein